MRNKYIVYFCLIVIGFVIALVNYINSFSFLETKEQGNYITGVVSNVESSVRTIHNEDTGKTTRSTYYEYFIDYEYDGKEYSDVFLYESKYSPFYSEGDTIQFLIDVNDSSVLYGPDVNISYYGAPIILSLGFSLLVFLIGLNDFVMSKIYEKRKRRHGTD